jgi:peptidoglycan hydrolase CwlO-like protein
MSGFYFWSFLLLCSLMAIATAVYLLFQWLRNQIDQEYRPKYEELETKRKNLINDRSNMQYQFETEWQRIKERKAEFDSTHQKLLQVIQEFDARWQAILKRESELQKQVDQLKFQLTQARRRVERVEKQAKNKV